MLISVFYDLRYFLIFFALVVAAFSLVLSILVDQDEKNYEGLGIFSFYVMAFRTSIGDYNLDNYAAGSEFKLLSWIVWFFIMIFGNIIFMNFIIAVVNESYENCMMKMVAQSYMVKLDMIVERELIMTKAQRKNPKWFPPYILFRKPVDSQGGQDGEEW